MTTIIVSAIILVTAICVGWILLKPKLYPAAMRSPAPRPKKSLEQEFTEILETLLKTNLMIRKDPHLPLETIEKIEAIMDDLKAVMPAMMEKYPSETLTYEIKKIGQSHLYKTVKEFLDMSLVSRQAQSGVFEKTIGSLRNATTRSREIVEKNETAEFKTMAHFIAGKFS